VALNRTLKVEHCMGTTFTIDIRDEGSWTAAIDTVVAWLHVVDETFSTYREHSDISRIRRGELRVSDAHPHVADVLDLCARAQATTRGYFSSLLQGRLDPTGLVKGWSIEVASLLLRELGSEHHAINGGGDIQLSGEAAPGRPWTVGISDPLDRSRVLATVRGRDFAVATSGVAERGSHILNPFTSRPAEEVAGVTVIGPTLTDADCYATAAFAMGDAAIPWVDSLDGFEALLVTDDGVSRRTSGWPQECGCGVQIPPRIPSRQLQTASALWSGADRLTGRRPAASGNVSGRDNR
jgi:thiamine biosynthesis lipoprotein